MGNACKQIARSPFDIIMRSNLPQIPVQTSVLYRLAAIPAREVLVLDGRHLDVKIDPVKQGTGDPRHVLLDLHELQVHCLAGSVRKPQGHRSIALTGANLAVRAIASHHQARRNTWTDQNTVDAVVTVSKP